MNRRHFLALAGVGASVGSLAGCSDTQEPSSRPVVVDIASREPVPDIPVAPAVTVTDVEPTDEHPARLRMTWTNPTDEPVRVGEYREATFVYVRSEPRGVRLLPTTDGKFPTYEPSTPGCWQTPEQHTLTMTGEWGWIDVPPGGDFHRPLAIWGTPAGDTDLCHPTGAFAFQSDVHLGGNSDPSDPDARWGFTIEIDEKR